MNRPLEANDAWGGVGLRDLWDVTPRLQVDLNVRFDWDRQSSSPTPSPRVGVRYVLDESARTTVKASAGRFVGRAPLGAAAFAQFPMRVDRSFDPLTGAVWHG